MFHLKLRTWKPLLMFLSPEPAGRTWWTDKDHGLPHLCVLRGPVTLKILKVRVLHGLFKRTEPIVQKNWLWVKCEIFQILYEI